MGYNNSGFLPTETSGCIAIDPQNTNIIYYATGGVVENFFGYNYYGLGVFKSTDYGETWTGGHNIGLPLQTFSFRILVNPVYSNIIYLAENTGLFISNNAGVTWDMARDLNGVPVSQGNNISCQDVITSSNGKIVYIAGGHSAIAIHVNPFQWPDGIGYWKSTNSGTNFTHMTNSGFNPEQRTSLAISPQNDSYIYGVTVRSITNIYAYAYVSTNAGSSFAPIFNVEECAGDCGGTAWDFLFIEACPADYNFAIFGFGNSYTGGGLYITTNGSNFTQSSPLGPDQNCLAFSPGSSTEVFLGDDNGLEKSGNRGGSWQGLNSSLKIAENYRISSDISNPDNIMVGVEDGGYSRTIDGGNTWTVIDHSRDGTNVLISARDRNPIFNQRHVIGSKGASSGVGAEPIKYSIDGGLTFIDSDMNGFWDSFEDWIAVLKEDPKIEGVFFCPLRGIAGPPEQRNQININLTTNYGQNWISNSNSQYSNFRPIPTGDICESPQNFEMCEADTNILYVSTVNYGPGDCYPNRGSRLWKSTDAGADWTPLFVNSHGVPNRYISSVTTIRDNANIVYLTLSGFDPPDGSAYGHVFKSVNGGASWFDIDELPHNSASGLPNIPVNRMIIRPISSTRRQLIIATDAGVYEMIDNDPVNAAFSWQTLADRLPNSIAMGLDFNNATLQLRVALFGRSAYEVNLLGPVYVSSELILQSSGSGLNIGDDIVVEPGAVLKIAYNCTIKMPTGKHIIVQDGGQIDCSSGNAVTFTSQSGSWGGIEFQGNGSGTLSNCTFSNADVPISIDGSNGTSSPAPIAITNCTFNTGSVTISNRNNVTVNSCTTNTSGSTGIGIFVNYGNSIAVSRNRIHNATIGISVSNSSPFIASNTIDNNNPNQANTGISLDNSYSSVLNNNTITGYKNGVYLYNSSPVMLSNSAIDNNSVGGVTTAGLYANYLSSPRLVPTVTPSGTVWDGGLNILRSNYLGSGMYIWQQSKPNTDYGYNTIYGYNNYISGWIGDPFYPVNSYSSRKNCWVDAVPVAGKFTISDATVYYSPYTCNPPGGGGEPGQDNPLLGTVSVLSDGIGIENNQSEVLPVQFRIVDYGNGVYDTINETNLQSPQTDDQVLFSQAMDKELNGNFTDAITVYHNVIQNYRDSTTAITSMKKILYCNDRMHADTNAYLTLRTFYQTLIQNNPTDTAVVKTAKEIASKCLVRVHHFTAAINEYENVVSTSHDSLEVLCAQLNIIETYMIIQNGGGNGPNGNNGNHGKDKNGKVNTMESVKSNGNNIISSNNSIANYTGKLASLKPSSKQDGILMILEKLHHIKRLTVIAQIPKIFSLSQNYPNPFNPTTTIKYSLPTDSKVVIKIYDILGREVATLVNDFRKAGFYQETFDGTNLASGVYFYHIEAGTFIQSKKMVLVK